MTFHPITSISKRATRLRSFPILVQRSGGKFLLDPRNWIDNRIAAGLPHEAAEIAIATDCIRANALDTLLDVGANIGLYTTILGRLPEVKKVVAFEPVRRNYNQMLGNVFANGLDAKVDAYRLALSDTSGEAVIHIDPNSTGVSCLEPSGSGRSMDVYTRREVIQTARCDDVVSLTDRRIYMKIDVEGHAIAALSGMDRLFRNNVVFIQVEADDAEAPAVTSLLERYGLRPSGATGHDRFYAPADSNG